MMNVDVVRGALEKGMKKRREKRGKGGDDDFKSRLETNAGELAMPDSYNRLINQT